MIKILHTADWHLGKRLQEYSRIGEQRLVMLEIAAIADDQDVDAVFVAGDLFDVFNPSHDSQELFYSALFKLSNGGKRPVIAIAGNHDSHALIEAPVPLAKELGIVLVGSTEHQSLDITLPNGVRLQSKEANIIEIFFPEKNETAVVITAPYANEHLLRTYLGEQNREEELRKILKLRWETLAKKYFTKTSLNFFIGHFFFVKDGEKPSAEPESERSILHVGGAQAIYSSDLPNGLHYAALGHLHRHQCIDSERFPVVYSSSPLCYSFSEAGQQKCVVIFDSDFKKYETIDLKQGYELVRMRFESVNEAVTWLEAYQENYVEITIASDGPLEAESRRSIMAAHPRIVHLIPEIKNLNQTDSALQSSDLSLDMTTLFSKFFKAENGTEPSEELLTMLREVMNEEGQG
jgi:exonuclease SbcD